MNNRILYNHDCRQMPELPDNSVQCVVTSPPYWGLRKYAGNQDLVWGGDNHHEHDWVDTTYVRNNDQTAGPKQRTNVGAIGRDEPVLNGFCRLCAAWRGAYGLEPTVEMYVQHTIEILREIRRVLRPDGVVFWNVGDSYNAGRNGGWAGGKHGISRPEIAPTQSGVNAPGLKPKDLCLIPFRVALAAQNDGWWVRSDIIWNKPNPMPESVTDRPTDSYEHILMLTKSARYYWDMEAVKEEAIHEGRLVKATGEHSKNAKNCAENDIRTTLGFTQHDTLVSGRNLRNVWTFPTQSYKGAHFATFPEELPERCIKAATSERGCCPKCGKPWERIVERHETLPTKDYNGKTKEQDPQFSTRRMLGNVKAWRDAGGDHDNPFPPPKTLGWQPGCECNAGEPIPCLVLDPFAGSGTTLKVAAELGRRAVGYEISEEYCRLIESRNAQGVLG